MRTINYIGRKVRYQKVVTASGRSLVFFMPRQRTRHYHHYTTCMTPVGADLCVCPNTETE